MPEPSPPPPANAPAAPAPDRYHAHREALAARNYALAIEASRETRRDIVLTALRCLFWLGAGLFCLMWSFHTSDATYGRAAFWAGLGMGNGGIIFSLLGLYRRGEARGDW